MEIVIDGLSNTPEQASRFALQAVQQQHTALPSIPGFTGWLLVYSSTYMHQASLVYQNGTLQPGSVQIQTIRPLQATAARSQSAFITESEPAPATNLRDGETTCIRVTICGTVNGTPAGCETTTYCVEGGDDGSGGSGGGGGGEGGWGGPAGPGGPSSSVPTSESIDPSVVLTPAVNPPDVLEYNCDQLRNTHSDDQYQSAPTTLANFIQANSGKSRSQIIAQRGFQTMANGMITLSKGPILRYIQDPKNPDVIIDLRHMLVVAYYGPSVGNSVEVIQGWNDEPSAYDHQDYYSNQLGYDFYHNYGSSVSSEPGRFLEFLNDFLTQPTNGSGLSNRSRNTNPALVNQRCP